MKLLLPVPCWDSSYLVTLAGIQEPYAFLNGEHTLTQTDPAASLFCEGECYGDMEVTLFFNYNESWLRWAVQAGALGFENSFDGVCHVCEVEVGAYAQLDTGQPMEATCVVSGLLGSSRVAEYDQVAVEIRAAPEDALWGPLKEELRLTEEFLTLHSSRPECWKARQRSRLVGFYRTARAKMEACNPPLGVLPPTPEFPKKSAN